MELINYDDLYEKAVVDFSNSLGLKIYNPQYDAQDNSVKYDLTEYIPYNNNTTEDISNKDKENTSAKDNNQKKPQNYSQFKGFEAFNRIYDKVQAYNPDAAKYRSLLTKIASLESSFNPSIVNKIGAAGYFQFIDSTRNGIMKKLGKSTSKQAFLNNPELQILAAIELAKEFEHQFSNEDIRIASQKGHSINGLISGAWLGGIGGVRRYLKRGINSSDGGTTVLSRIKIGDQV